MELKRKFIINALTGFILGMFIGIIFWVIYGNEMVTQRFILQLVMSGLLGMISFGVMTVYEIESWGVSKATAVHYLTWLITFLATAIPMKWFEPWYELLIAVVIMTVIYVLIWLGFYLHWKKTIRQLNKQLEIMHEHTAGEEPENRQERS